MKLFLYNKSNQGRLKNKIKMLENIKYSWLLSLGDYVPFSNNKMNIPQIILKLYYVSVCFYSSV